MSKEELKELKWRENNDDLSELIKSEVGKAHSLKNYVTYLKVKRCFPSEERELRCNTITLDAWEEFIRDPNSTTML